LIKKVLILLTESVSQLRLILNIIFYSGALMLSFSQSSGSCVA